VYEKLTLETAVHSLILYRDVEAAPCRAQ